MSDTTLDDIAALRRALRSGHSRVQYKDRTVEYRSLEEIRSILQEMEVEAGLRSPGRRRTTPTYDSGL
jgi:hypothetical protein